jgi:hypothetical protein
MGLIDKVRTLIGALVHKPFMPRPEKVDLGQEPGQRREPTAHGEGSELEQQQPQVTDSERVADLIAQQRRQEAD